MELSPRMLELATPRKPRRMGGASMGDVDDMGVSLKRNPLPSNLTQHSCMFLLASGAMLVQGSACVGQRHN